MCDGHEATRRIRAIELEKGLRRTPIVALSASCSDEEVRRCTLSGMDGHLAKPLRAQGLAQFKVIMDRMGAEAAAAGGTGTAAGL